MLIYSIGIHFTATLLYRFVGKYLTLSTHVAEEILLRIYLVIFTLTKTETEIGQRTVIETGIEITKKNRK